MRKLILKSLLVASMSSVVFTGCWWNDTTVGEAYVDTELQGAPKWVLVPQVKGFVAELGSASKNAGNDFSFQREEAMADARDNIARQISVKVNNMFKAFKSVTGSGADSTFDKSSEKVSKQIASQTLSGTKVQDTWMSKSGTLYILMVIDTKSVVDIVEKNIKTSFKNDKAMYQKFLASKAQGELDQELEKLNN